MRLVVLLAVLCVLTLLLIIRPANKAADFAEISNCLALPWQQQNKCLDDFLRGYGDQKTVRQLLSELELIGNTNPQLRNNCHVVSHAIGRYATTTLGNVGDAFEACDFTCSSGCYHGAVERLFFSDEQLAQNIQHLSYSQLAAKVTTICTADKFKNPTQFVIFQCLHGLGHAILFTGNYNLRDSLKLCDLLGGGFESESCAVGVFMENITAFDKTKRDLKPADVQYPCNSVDEKHRGSCYFMHTSLLLELGKNFQQIAEICKQADGYQYSCFESYGRDLFGFFILPGQMQLAVNACEIYAGQFKPSCMLGVVKHAIDREYKYGYQFCAALSDSVDRKLCFGMANFHANYAHYQDYQARVNLCRDFSGADAKLCTSTIDQPWQNWLPAPYR